MSSDITCYCFYFLLLLILFHLILFKSGFVDVSQHSEPGSISLEKTNVNKMTPELKNETWNIDDS